MVKQFQDSCFQRPSHSEFFPSFFRISLLLSKTRAAIQISFNLQMCYVLLLNLLPGCFCYPPPFKEWCFVRCLRYFVIITSLVSQYSWRRIFFLRTNKLTSRFILPIIQMKKTETWGRTWTSIHSSLYSFNNYLLRAIVQRHQPCLWLLWLQELFGPSSLGVSSLTRQSGCYFPKVRLGTSHLCLTYFWGFSIDLRIKTKIHTMPYNVFT